MLKKSITYTSLFTGEQVTEDHYFHISKADLVRMQMEEHGDVYVSKSGEELEGMAAKLQRIIEAQDGKSIISTLEDIIRRSYGLRDGNKFIKNDKIWDEFSATEAYSQLLYDLCTNAEEATLFQQGIIPKDLNLEDIQEEVKASLNGESAEESVDEVKSDEELTTRQSEIEGATIENPVTLTDEEMRGMARHKLQIGIGEGRFQIA